MSSKIRIHIRTNAIGYLALFVALTIAPAWAASLRPNSVKSTQIKNGQVKTADLGSNSVTSPKIADGQVTVADIATGAVTNAKLGAAAVTTAKVANGAITGDKVADDSIKGVDVDENSLSGLPATGPAGGDLTDFFPNPHIATGAVNSAKVADGSLVGIDINESTLDIVPDADHLDGLHANQFMRSDEGASGDLTGNYPAPSIASGAVNSAKVSDNSLTGTDINESTLGLVSNSDQLDGLHATAFLRSDALAQGDLAGSFPAPVIRDGVVGIPKLSFDPATQGELDAHKSSGDHDAHNDARYWKQSGNSGTNPASSFLGTTDDQPLNFKVNGSRALRLEPGSNLIGGDVANSVSAGVESATIAGGGRSPFTSDPAPNTVTGDSGTVGGGFGNSADVYGTVAGGANNLAGSCSFVGGGGNNVASGNCGTVGGGSHNTATGAGATVAGGSNNTAASDAGSTSTTVGGGLLNSTTGNGGTIPGGFGNEASGTTTFAAGYEARAHHDGAFVWADHGWNTTPIASTADNQFIARARGNFFLQNDSSLDDQGGFINTSTGAYLTTGGTWTNSSDENLKDGFTPVKPSRVLAKVAALPVTSWQYKAERGVRHLGPTGQDFRKAFGLGADGRHISSVDADGVALVAIKGLANENRELRAEMADLRSDASGAGHGANPANPAAAAAAESPSTAVLTLLGAALLAMGALGTALVIRRFNPPAGHPA